MKYIYLSCAPENRDLIKRKLKHFMQESYLLVDQLEDCNEMLIIGKSTADMYALYQKAKKLDIQIRYASTKQILNSDKPRARHHGYDLEM